MRVSLHDLESRVHLGMMKTDVYSIRDNQRKWIPVQIRTLMDFGLIRRTGSNSRALFFFFFVRGGGGGVGGGRWSHNKDYIIFRSMLGPTRCVGKLNPNLDPKP